MHAKKFGGAIGLLLALSAGARAHDEDDRDGRAFSRIATFPVYLNSSASVTTAAEIVTATEDGKTLIYTDSPSKKLGFVDIKDPEKPKADGTMSLSGEPTSVAILGSYALVAVNTSADFVNVSGVLLVVHVSSRTAVASIDLGGQPDCIAVSPDGRYAAVAIENERDPAVNGGALPQSPAGWLSVIRLKGNPSGWTAKKVDLTGLAASDRFPGDPEPEYVDINEDNVAVVTLQENNHIVLVDLEDLEVTKHFPAGKVDLDEIDTEDDDQITLDSSLEDVPREPDAVQWIGDDRFLTANEGDLSGGSRGFTIFSKYGKVLFDSDNRYEHLGVRHGHYPDGRSDAKGTEPEGAEIARFGSDTLAFVGSERGNFVAVFELDKDCRPDFRQLLPCTPGPEGLHAIPHRKLLVVSSEEDDASIGIRSTISIYRLESGDPDYPDVVSENDADGLPIPWGALSGLAADRWKSDILWAITDSIYSARPRILKIDADCEPARIVKEILVTKGGVAPNYDLEGIVQRRDGGFWLASEGSTPNATGRKNLLIRVNALGQVQEEIGLPADLESKKTGNGFEGVTLVDDGDEEILYVAIQREWPLADGPNNSDGSSYARIAEYRTETGGWRFFHYLKEVPPAGATVGLSEIVAVDDETFALIERDNLRGPNVKIKWITEISIKGVTPVAHGGTIPKLTKKLVRDLLPDLNRTHGWTQDKVEGLAISRKGRTFVVTDNDGLDDATGETLFFDFGDYDDLDGDGKCDRRHRWDD